MTRYHPLLVALHWLLAIMIIVALIAGNVLLDATPNSDPHKIDGLRAHMSIGMAIGILLIIRLITRWRSQKPPHAQTGSLVLDFAGQAAHWALYILSLLMVASGIGIAISAGLGPIVFQGSGAPLPESFGIYPPRIAHGILSKLLILTIAAHVLGWIYHQFILRDNLIRRMWFGDRRH